MKSTFLLKLLDSVHDGVYFVDRDRRITFWNKGAERITGYRAEEVIGTRCSDNILEHVDRNGCGLCNGHCPLCPVLQGDATESLSEIFLHHREGYRVPVNVHASPIVGPGGKIVGAAEIFSESVLEESYSALMGELKDAALLDPLTGIGNRRLLDMKLTQSLADLGRYAIPFGIIVFDVDRFKEVNDVYGHLAGDRVLKAVADTVRLNLRGSDLATRYGGDEFILILAHVSATNLARLAEKLRVLIEMSFLGEGAERISVTASMGATMALPEDTAESLIQRADCLLYRAKKEGRNRCVTG